MVEDASKEIPGRAITNADETQTQLAGLGTKLQEAEKRAAQAEESVPQSKVELAEANEALSLVSVERSVESAVQVRELAALKAHGEREVQALESLLAAEREARAADAEARAKSEEATRTAEEARLALEQRNIELSRTQRDLERGARAAARELANLREQHERGRVR